MNIAQMKAHRERLFQVQKDNIVHVAQKYLKDKSAESSKVIFGPENPNIEIPGWSVFLPINS